MYDIPCAIPCPTCLTPNRCEAEQLCANSLAVIAPSIDAPTLHLALVEEMPVLPPLSPEPAPILSIGVEIDYDPTLPHIQVHVCSQKCLNCGASHIHSQIYECITQSRKKILLPCRGPHSIPSDYPVVAHEIPTVHVPICHACLDSRSKPDAERARRWSETLTRKHNLIPVPQLRAKAELTLDDI